MGAVSGVESMDIGGFASVEQREAVRELTEARYLELSRAVYSSKSFGDSQARERYFREDHHYLNELFASEMAVFYVDDGSCKEDRKYQTGV